MGLLYGKYHGYVFYGGSIVKKKKKALKGPAEFNNEYNLQNALKKGDIFTKLSFVIMGLGNIVRKQIIKGLIFLAVEVAFIYFMVSSGIHCIAMLPSLGDKPHVEEWNEALQVFTYNTDYDVSYLILLYGVVSIVVCVLFVVFWRASVKSAYKVQVLREKGKHVNNIFQDIKDLFDVNLHKLLLSLPVTGVLVFTILPLIYMICMAFTDYNGTITRPDGYGDLFDWTGLQSFTDVLSLKGSVGKEFWSVLGWTLIWAVLATFLNYIVGMILAIIINRKGTRLKGMWRFFFILSIAIPQFVSLLIIRTLLDKTGPINNTLIDAGIIDKFIPFLSDATMARVTVVIVNLWVGIPYTMLQVTGILQNIPADLYEAAKVDGANAITQFFKITLPYMLFVTAPYLVTTFTGNVNNFNVIYLLTAGAPTPVGNTAGKTDLLVTWLYKLTVDNEKYNIGAVIGIMTFVVLSIVSLVTYRNTGSYKDEEGFQ